MNELGFLLGMAAAHALDPLVLGTGLIAGVAASRWWHRLAAVAILTILLGITIRAMNDFAPGDWAVWSGLARGVALLVWATVGWGIRVVATRWQT